MTLHATGVADRMSEVARESGIWRMYVAPFARGAGLGRTLLRDSLRGLARVRGIEQVNLARSECARIIWSIHAAGVAPSHSPLGPTPRRSGRGYGRAGNSQLAQVVTVDIER